MEHLKNNPYRVLGLLAGVSAREQERQIRRLKQFIDAGQDPPTDYSFPVFGDVKRTPDSLVQAVAKLNLNEDRIKYALFWFYNGSHTDEPAFDYLHESKIQECQEIWSKLADSVEITIRNTSAAHNLSTLLLLNTFNATEINYELLQKSIKLKLTLLESDCCKKFVFSVVDETYRTSNKKLQIDFLEMLFEEIQNLGSEVVTKFIKIVLDISFSGKDEFLNLIADRIILEVNNLIEQQKNFRKSSPEKIVTPLKIFTDRVTVKVSQLKILLTQENVKRNKIIDKAAEEILQGGIDYFQKLKDTNEESGHLAMKFFRKADKLAEGKILKQRCKENIEGLQGWIDAKPEREKHSLIVQDSAALFAIFEEFETKQETIDNATALLISCKPLLDNIKLKLGSTDELYIMLSTRVGAQAQSYIIDEINRVQEKLISYNNLINDKNPLISVLQNYLRKAWSATLLIGDLDLEYDFKKNRYHPNRQTLFNICKQAGIFSQWQNSNSFSKNTGCLVALLALIALSATMISLTISPIYFLIGLVYMQLSNYLIW